MDSERWSEIGKLFDAVVDLAPAERKTFLDQSGADEQTIGEVMSLISEDRDTVNLLDAVSLDAANLVDEMWSVGRRVGPYTIVRRIGKGGMGSVFLAERSDGEFEQQVALKLVRPERNTKDFVRRFRSERQILARLQHPNIARLLDGGMADDGHLYFAMEYIDGDPIDTYCDRNRLTIDDRLNLFSTAARAVHYAHQQLIVHRDLKPENILVDRDGNVKLLDFGIARLLDDDKDALHTAGALMTPEYASPEQIRGEPLGTSSDLYSLGVILYELLSGRRPYEFEGRAPAQVADVVLNAKVESPSTVVLTTNGDQKGKERLSQARQMAPERLHRRLCGDLDTICLKALRKEPEERYGSASDLAEDVDLHQRGMPVSARPYTATYRVQKFLHRNRTGVLLTTLGILLIGSMGTYYTLELRSESERARIAAHEAERVADFLKSIFQVADPTVAQGETITARQLLDDGARRIEADLEDIPDIQARMMGVIGDVYMGLGLYPQADTLYSRALGRIRQVYPDDRNAEVAEALNRLAVLRRLQGEYGDAERLARDAVLVWDDVDALETAPAAKTLNSLAEALREQGRYEEAETAYRQALELRRRLLDGDHRDIADNLNNLSLLLLAEGKLEDARQMQVDALAMRRRLFEEKHPDVLNSLNNLAVVLRATADFAEAESLFTYTIGLRREVLGDDDPRTANTIKNFGILYADKGDYRQAEHTLREALRLFQNRLPDNHPQVMSTTRYLAGALQLQGRYSDAKRLYETVLESSRVKLGSRHPEVANALSDLGGVHRLLRDYGGAERLHREALEIRREVFGDDHADVTTSLNHLAVLLAEQERYDEAEPLYRQAVDIRRRTLGRQHPRVAVPLTGLAVLMREKGDLATAEQLFRESLDLHRRGYGATHERTAHALMGLASVLSSAGRHAEALPLVEEAQSIRKSSLGDDHWRTAQANVAVGANLVALGRISEGEPLVVGGYEMLVTVRGPDAPETLRAAMEVVRLYDALGETEKATAMRISLDS
ncbi:MAG: tetratricopeptide repeat protein [Rhodothermia bacterium]|nr:tetratricopeptide repeat protein [Rhodothermia bacterium]